MAALLKIIIFWHLIAYSLQEDAKSPKSKTETPDPSSGSNSIKQLTGDFDHYLTESLTKQAIGLKEMEVRLILSIFDEDVYLTICTTLQFSFSSITYNSLANMVLWLDTGYY